MASSWFYRQPDAPDVGDDPAATAFSPLYWPLLELEAEARGTGYIHVVSVSEAWQGRGIGSELLRHAERWRDPQGMSLIVSDHNERARQLYERQGYRAASRRPIVKDGWQTPGTSWVLMRKP